DASPGATGEKYSSPHARHRTNEVRGAGVLRARMSRAIARPANVSSASHMTAYARSYCSVASVASHSGHGSTTDLSASGLGDVEHALQRDACPLRGLGVDGDAVDDATLDQFLEHPAQVRRVDAEHRRAGTHERIERHDRLAARCLVGGALHEVDLRADRDR